MKTLKELFDEYGSVWLAHRNMPNKKYLKPLGYSERTTNYIICDSYYETDSSLFQNDITNLIVYTPPKKTVRKYLWAVLDEASKNIYLSDVFRTDKESKNRYDSRIIKRMDDLFIDVEE